MGTVIGGHAMRVIGLRCLSVALALLPVPAIAHHGWSGYDSAQTLTLTGVIRESGYEHPHGHVKLEVPGKTWHVVLAPPTRMERRGLLSSMLAVGTQATVVGYPHRRTPASRRPRSEEHTSELQSRLHLVCRLLLEKKKKNTSTYRLHT